MFLRFGDVSAFSQVPLLRLALALCQVVPQMRLLALDTAGCREFEALLGAGVGLHLVIGHGVSGRMGTGGRAV